MKSFTTVTDALLNGCIDGIPGACKASLFETEGTKIIMLHSDSETLLAAAGKGPLLESLEGSDTGSGKICPCSHANRLVLQRHLSFLIPSAAGKNRASIGLGDRLGRATPGHIRTVAGKAIFPVFAQQSIRELNLTGRTYEGVLDDAVYAVLREGYMDGFGADGDHLKTEADIEMALNLGFTMITLDCSEKIGNGIQVLSDAEVSDRFASLPLSVRARYQSYADREIACGKEWFRISNDEMMRTALIYHSAVDFMSDIWERFIKNAGRSIDFEISIDETLAPTAPAAHYIIAQELHERGVDVTSLAPRFCGEFQKGIDYIGDITLFKKEFALHAAIAKVFGYKVSIHSGSDKFSVFPVIACHTAGLFHVKTAGTNWLEAVTVMAIKESDLYRRMHGYALEHFNEARAFYHVTTNLNAIRPLSSVSDAELASYMTENDARQLLHITYGILLNAQDRTGQDLFRTAFFRALAVHEQEYFSRLRSHIGRHLSLLGK
jgi:hypothetical protein